MGCIGGMRDLPTLRLAGVEATPELLRAFVMYQRAMIEALAGNLNRTSNEFARAHHEAQQKSGLETQMLHKLRAVVAAFCTNRMAMHLAKEKNVSSKHVPTAADLEKRFGPQSCEALFEREAELLELHRQMRRAEEGNAAMSPPQLTN
jgi:hypothetical protein